MKKKLLSIFMLSILFVSFSFAQNRNLTGKVISAEDGQPLPGVTVVATGTTVGTTTDNNGNFSLSVPNGTASLQFKFIGFADQTVPLSSSNLVNVTLSLESSQLGEVVITGAYGTQQSSRSTSYSAQVVSSEELNVTRQPNLNNALAGKVAGLQVRSQSSAALGRESTIRLRGASGFGGGTGALYVVDGTILPSADDVNLDDIESVSVLQGPAASALFGAQAADGAIVITLKKGRQAQGLGVTFNLGATFENPYILPNYQNSYAGGASSSLMQYNWKAGDPEEWKSLDGKYYHDYNDDSSWGPRMVGQEYIPWYAWYGGHSRSYQTAALTPQPDNAFDFFNTGVVLNNSLTISSASDNLDFKLTYGNNDTRGLIPNSHLTKHTVNLISSYDLTDRLEVSANISYINRNLKGEIDDEYSNQSTGAFSQWFHRDLDMDILKELRDLRTPDGIFASWNHRNPNTYSADDPRSFYAANYWYNPFTYYDLVDITQQRDRLYGNLSLNYKITDDLSISGTYRKQQNTTFNEDKYSSRLNESGLQTTGNNALAKGYYATGTSYSNRRNIEFLATYKKNFMNDDLSLDANVGTDFFRWVSKGNNAATANGLSVPDLFTISNSVDQAVIGNSRTEERYNAIFARATVGYKNYLFVNGSLRNDWFSTLPEDNNDVLSKSFGASFVFTDLLSENSSNFDWLSFGKIRASWGEIPKALGTSQTTFGAYRYPGMAYSVNQFKWGNNFLMSTPDQLVDPNITGSVVRQKELGLELRFLENRLGVSGTYWDGTEEGFPYSLSLNGASGFSTLLTNIGKISKKGIELQLEVNPVRTANFDWNFSGTYANLIENDIVEISQEYGITQTAAVGGVWGTTMPYMVHTEGKRWGQIYGNGIQRNDAGVPILTENGSYINDPDVYFGSVLPEITGGIQNSFTFFKDFNLRFNLDYQVGGKFVSLSNMFGTFSGLTARTASLNDRGNPVRDAVADGGGVHVFGVDADNNPVDYYVEAQTYYQNLYNNSTFDEFIYDLSFVKMREIALTYRIPVQKLSFGSKINSASISLVAGNPFLIWAKTDDFDPSEVSYVNGETGQLPGTRTFGFNLRVGF